MDQSLETDVSSIRYKIFRLTRICFLLALLGGVCVAFDYLYGAISGISNVREDARRFRSEAAILRTSTRAMVPNTKHDYRDAYRPEGDALIPGKRPRQLVTTPFGTVSTGTPPSAVGPNLLFLGGSTTECNEVDEPYRYPAVVERSLRESGGTATVVNAGVRGHTSLDAINTLLNRPDLGGADVIVLMENINDRLRLAVRGGYGAELHDAAPTSFSAVRDSAGATLRAAWDYLAYQSNILFLMESLPERFGATRDVEGGWITERTLDELPLPSGEAQQLYAQNIRLFVAIVRALGKTPVLMTQPLGRHSPAQALFNERIRAVSQETDTTLVDLDGLLPGDRGWAFLDDNIHLNNRGAIAVGHIIAERVAPLIGRRFTAPEIITGLTNLTTLAESCQAPGTVAQLAQPSLHKILGDSGRYPSVSPDGGWLLYQSRTASADRIRLLRLADRQLFDLSPVDGTTNERHPAFLDASADELSIVFGASRVGESADRERLTIRSWPSGKTSPLYADPDLAGSIPMVLRQSVYFAGSKDVEGSRAPNIYRFDRVTSHIERLTSSSAEQWRPHVTKAGDIFFISNPNGRFSIHRRDYRSGEVSPAISSSADEWDPAVSPDGKWLAFASKRHGTWDIFVAPTDDLHAQRRMTELPGDEWDPSWHPSGRVLLFGSAQSRESKVMALCPFGETKPGR